MAIRKKAAEFIRNKQVKLASQSDNKVIINVGEGKDMKTVILQKKPGRTIISCSCQLHAKFCNEGSLCSHKLAAMFAWTWEGMK